MGTGIGHWMVGLVVRGLIRVVVRIALLTAAVARALLCTNQTVRLEDVRRELLQMWGMLFDDCWLVLLLLLMTIAGMLMMIVVRPHVN